MKIFIDFWEPKEAWLKLSKSEREAYMESVGPVMAEMDKKGAITEAWGVNEDNSPQRADYGFFAIQKFPSDEVMEEFKSLLVQTKWHDYFEQKNLAGENTDPEIIIGKMIDL